MARVKTRGAMRTGDTRQPQTNQQMTIGDHVPAHNHSRPIGSSLLSNTSRRTSPTIAPLVNH